MTAAKTITNDHDMEEERRREVRFPQERHRKMADLIALRGHISVDELIETFAVSGPTVRRDLDFLARAGIAVRTHGGVTASDRAAGQEPLFMEKLRRQQAAKICIAQAAARQVEDGMRVMLDSGTTALALARLLAGRAIRMIATDIKAAEAAATGETEVIIAGGMVRNGYFGIVGEETAAAIAAQPKADIFFLSADAVDGNGVSNVTIEEARVKRAAIANAKRTVLIADHTKLDRREPAEVCAWSAIDLFITDRHSGAVTQAYAGATTRVELCSPGLGKEGKTKA
ncbi:DeoR/GlpR family DNA-binding transcription regulator [Georhizobium sp. MAB10]|uniref:DeoR/GlpR family DNA-binding transcription regulator n=1 Tax=Georhizobium sp. MAB10 TaxID=3028319 RepID=UPI003856034E